MQTVVNNYIINSTVVGSTILQGLQECTGISTVNTAQTVGGGIVAEIFRIICGLDTRRQIKALEYLQELERMADGS